jgi:hypothetical protein
LGERGVERGPADLDASRDLPNGEALGEERLGAPELFVRHDRFASALATARRRGVETGAGSFADEVALELPESAEDVKDEPSSWRRRVDRLG